MANEHRRSDRPDVAAAVPIEPPLVPQRREQRPDIVVAANHPAIDRPLHPAATERQRLWMGRGATLAAGVIATGMAVWLAWRGTTSLWDEYLKLVALIGGGFPGVFALGLLTRRANAIGVMIGALASVAVTWIVQNYTTTNAFLHGFVAVASCVVIGYVASLIFAGGVKTQKSLAGLTVWDRPKEQRT